MKAETIGKIENLESFIHSEYTYLRIDKLPATEILRILGEVKEEINKL